MIQQAPRRVVTARRGRAVSARAAVDPTRAKRYALVDAHRRRCDRCAPRPQKRLAARVG